MKWQSSWTLPSWIQPFCTKLWTQTPSSIWLKLIHSDWTRWWQPSWILALWIQPICTKLWLKLVQSDSNSFILTQLDEMAAILNSAMLDSDTAILDSDTLLSSLRFTQKYSHSTLSMTQSNSMMAAILNWWQPSWIQTLPSWIEPYLSYLLSDSLKNTLTPFWV